MAKFFFQEQGLAHTFINLASVQIMNRAVGFSVSVIFIEQAGVASTKFNSIRRNIQAMCETCVRYSSENGVAAMKYIINQMRNEKIFLSFCRDLASQPPSFFSTGKNCIRKRLLDGFWMVVAPGLKTCPWPAFYTFWTFSCSRSGKKAFELAVFKKLQKA